MERESMFQIILWINGTDSKQIQSNRKKRLLLSCYFIMLSAFIFPFVSFFSIEKFHIPLLFYPIQFCFVFVSLWPFSTFCSYACLHRSYIDFDWYHKHTMKYSLLFISFPLQRTNTIGPNLLESSKSFESDCIVDTVKSSNECSALNVSGYALQWQEITTFGFVFCIHEIKSWFFVHFVCMRFCFWHFLFQNII